ncbi:MAG: hypothetical protein CVT61_06225 [Actinobacteria bacterium HGW-Actinobacteria-11]|nr:MAG: hypothetical protein CVT61_06225 [Actinobacteria bacterium HGW-Actinobacteria-11]
MTVFASGSQLLTTEQLAEQLQIPKRTLEDWRYRGVGPKSVRLGKRARYRSNDIEDWLERLASSAPQARDAPVAHRDPRTHPTPKALPNSQ